MKNSNIILLLLTVLIVQFVTTGSAHSTTITTPADDNITYTLTNQENTYTTTNGPELYIKNVGKDEYEDNGDSISFFKFNLTAKTDYTPTSFSAYFISGKNTDLTLYYSIDDTLGNPDFSKLTKISTLSIDSKQNQGYITWDFNNINLSNALTDKDKILTLALFSDKKGVPTNIYSVDFNNDVNKTQPYLTMTDNASLPSPTPEPSSVILGIMSLVSLLGFRIGTKRFKPL